jgi:CBS domain-containing protein
MANLDTTLLASLRRELIAGRGIAELNAEGYVAIIQKIEMLGFNLCGKEKTLAKYLDDYLEFLQLPSDRMPEFKSLFKYVREARNKAIHEGAFARNLSRKTAELSMIFEGRIFMGLIYVRDVMIENPVTISQWDRISDIRRKLVGSAFSWLPILVNTEWMLLSEYGLLQFIQTTGVKDDVQIRDCMDKVTGFLVQAKSCRLSDTIQDIAKKIVDAPMLVIENGELRGIITASDLL